MATADMQLVMQLTQNFFFRNNPITAITTSVAQVIDKVVNFESHRKLMKYRCLLYKQQMSSLERNLDAGSLSPRGERMNRLY
jgi:hypothetical protein